MIAGAKNDDSRPRSRQVAVSVFLGACSTRCPWSLVQSPSSVRGSLAVLRSRVLRLSRRHAHRATRLPGAGGVLSCGPPTRRR